MGDGVNDCLVIENLCADSYFQVHSRGETRQNLVKASIPMFQVDKGTCKLAYMRAALSALASVHGTTLSFMKSLGGKEALLGQYQTIKEHLLPRNKVIKPMVEEAMFPFLMYMTRVQPDIAQQLMVTPTRHPY